MDYYYSVITTDKGSHYFNKCSSIAELGDYLEKTSMTIKGLNQTIDNIVVSGVINKKEFEIKSNEVHNGIDNMLTLVTLKTEILKNE